MNQPQAVGPQTVFDGAHFVSWRNDRDINVLGPDHLTRLWRRSSAGMYRLVDGPFDERLGPPPREELP